MDVDDCLSKVVGSFGRYQKLVYCLLLIYALVTPGLALLTVFVGEDPSKLKPDNYRVDNKSSILTEWGLLDQQWVGDVVQAVYFAGFLFGVVAFGQLSDRFGRRPAMIFGYLLLFPVCIWASFSSSIELFTATRFFTGFISGGVTLVQFVYLQEIVGRSWWVVTGSLQNFMFPLGILVFVFGAYFLPNWRHLIQFFAILQVPSLVFLMFVPESPRWLYAKGQLSKAEKILAFFAEWNGVKNPRCMLKPLQCDQPHRHYTLVQLFRHSVTAKRTLVMAFLWFVNSFVYYALTLAAGELGSNVYASEALSGVMELPSLLLCSVLLSYSWCGRRRGVSAALLVTGLSCLILMAFDPSIKSNGKMAIGLLGKMAVSFSFNGVYVYSPELFPTGVRNAALGCLSMFARVGGIASSFAKSLLMSHPLFGYFMFGAFGIAAGLLTFVLPETLGRKPPDSFEELEQPKFRSLHEDPDSFVLLDSSGFRNDSKEEIRELFQSANDETDELL